MAGKNIKLSERLMTIAGFIEKGAKVADIGTGDGHLPVYLMQNGLASHAIASDKSAASIDTVLRTANKYGVADKIVFTASPGLSGIDEEAVDTIVIAGMGGETISKILDDAPWTKRRGIKLILQPQTKTEKLCSWLRENGYSIPETAQAQDKGRAYTVISAEGAVGAS